MAPFDLRKGLAVRIVMIKINVAFAADVRGTFDPSREFRDEVGRAGEFDIDPDLFL